MSSMAHVPCADAVQGHGDVHGRLKRESDELYNLRRHPVGVCVGYVGHLWPSRHGQCMSVVCIRSSRLSEALEHMSAGMYLARHVSDTFEIVLLRLSFGHDILSCALSSDVA